MNRLLATFLAAALLVSGNANAQLLAFPEAEGFGRYATGARGNLGSAQVVHVTNLNDTGPGSLRDALSGNNRFVIFDVGGIIELQSVLTMGSNITIAGQTAPGGITVYSDRVAFHNANNLISRHWAIRKGDPGVRDDAASIARGSNMIFDHMSITWGVDGTFDINADSGHVIDNITIQNSIIAQGLDRLGHSTGGLMQPGDGGSVSVIDSLWADNVTRNPKVRAENEFINNVVYGWENAAYIMGDTAGSSYANVVGNYFIEGPVNGSHPFSSGTPSFNLWADDNWVDTDRDGVLDGTLVTSYPGATLTRAPHAFPTTADLSAQQAVENVMANAGPHIVRDAVDTRLMQEVASYGTLGGVIQRETDLFPGFGTDPQYLNPRARLVDSDNDAIPDNWETDRGLNPNNPNDWRGTTPSGYAWIEVYLNELGADGVATNSSTGEWSSPGTWSGGVPTLADTAAVAGDVTVSSGAAFARRVHVDGSLAVSAATLDVFDTLEATGPVSVSGGAVTAGRVVLGGPNGSVSLGAGGVLQTGTVAHSSGAGDLEFDGGTFRATGAPNITVGTTVHAGGATFDTNGHSGEIAGPITGSGGLTKRGAGVLTLSGSTNSYAGPTVVEEGTLAIQNSVLNATESITVEAAGTLDTSSLSSVLTLNSGKSLDGSGRVVGSVTANAGAVVRPRGQFTASDQHAIGVQAEDLALGSDWAIFNAAAHAGSYNGADLNGGGIVLVSGENTSSPNSTGAASTLVDIPTSGDWFLYVKAAEPSVSAIPGDSATHPGGNNSIYVSANASSLTASTSNFVQLQTPDNDADRSHWTLATNTLAPLDGVSSPLIAGIDYSLSAGEQTFRIYGREAGTVVDGFVLSDTNLTATELEAVLSGQSISGGEQSLTIVGDYQHHNGALLAIDLEGADSLSRLAVDGTAWLLGGDIAVALEGGYTPDAGDTFEVLTADTIVGEFANAAPGQRVGLTGGGGSFVVNYDLSEENVTLSDFQSALAGDFNSDGVVDAADYTVWRDNVGQLESELPIGTGDGSRLVDAGDYDLWQANYEATAAPSLAVPEPTGVALLALAALAPVVRRR